MSNWTPEQQQAISKSGQNIIVSAGAGSGKTAVLTERVISKLDKIKINELLVLTFTNAAAAEMKDRIRKAIIKKDMKEQLDYLDSAYITTFDSFASSIVKKYHYLLNIPSSINVIEDTVITIEKNKLIDEIFEENYGNQEFDRLISTYSLKNDTEIKNFILSLNDKLDLKSNKDEYIDTYISKNFDDIYITSLVDKYVSNVINKANKIKELTSELKPYLNEKQYESLLIYLDKIITSSSYDEIISSLVSRAPGFQKLDEEAKTIYEDIKNLKKEIVSERYKYDDLKNNLFSTKDNIKVILSIVKELSKRLDKFKYEKNSFTFNDIAKMAIKVVKDNDFVKAELKECFKEIMVDEYQDTSDLQEEFLTLISIDNLYMVGDIKQSIYRFRHANPSIFKEKYDNYSKNNGGIKIDLLKNFRSRGEVLSNINTIFDLIMSDNIGNANYKVSHRMVPGNDMYDLKFDTNYNLEVLTYDKTEDYKKFSNAEIEAFMIALDIKRKVSMKYQVIDKETKNLRDINYGDFAIIMDRGSSFDIYSKIFEYHSIPTVIWSDEKLDSEDDIAILKNIVNLIIKIKLKDYSQEFKYYFTSVARSYLFSYDDNKILNIFLNNSFYEDEIYKICLSIANELDSVTNTELLDMIIDKFNVYEKTILKGNIDASMIRFDILSNLFASLSNLGYTPYDLPEYFINSKDLDIKYSLNTKVKGSVNIMNIHKSKGLEFSVCYYAGLYSKFNEQDIKNKFLYDDTYGIIIPFNKNGLDNTILRELSIDKYKADDISEKIRLFYVALTRAKEHMVIVCPKFKCEDNFKDLVPDNVRLSYKSLFDVLDSVNKELSDYTKLINLDDLKLTDKYNLAKTNDYEYNKFDKNIVHMDINLEKSLISESHFSKESHKLYDKEEIENMEKGTYMHYMFEVTDFKNPQTKDPKVLDFISKLDLNCNIYKEYEFYDFSSEKHGVIDLMLEYQDHIDIYDYKLKNTLDDAYKKQLSGYKKYIENKTKKPCFTYLYSILDEKVYKII